METIESLATKLTALQPPLDNVPSIESYHDAVRSGLTAINARVAGVETLEFTEPTTVTLDASYTRVRAGINCKFTYNTTTFLLTITSLNNPNRGASIIFEKGVLADFSNLTADLEALLLLAARRDIVLTQVVYASKNSINTIFGSTQMDFRKVAFEMRETYKALTEQYDSSCADHNRMIVAWNS